MTNQLTEDLGLVRRLARSLKATTPANVEVDDLIQAGSIGLLEARQNYIESDIPFESYAMMRIKGAMIDELRRQDFLPRTVRTSNNAIQKAIFNAERSNCSKASVSDIAFKMGASLEEYFGLLQESNMQMVFYHGVQTDNPDDESFLDREACDSNDPSKVMAERQLWAKFYQSIQNLPPREQEIVSLHQEGELFAEIGKKLGISESRTHQIHKRAVGMMRKEMECVL